MLKTKKELAEYLYKRCGKIVYNKEETALVVESMKSKYNIPSGMAMDLLAGRINLEDTSEFYLFILLDTTDEVIKKDKVKEYFTEIEINGYSTSKYEEEKFEFPIVIKCIPVSTDQWIGATDVNFLMSLRKAQLINYNTNAQRTMQKIVRGEKTLYKIALNKTAISEIRSSLNNETYIPNTITLNIPEDADYFYNEKDNTLVINNLDHFDISDGYHRYIAMCQEKDFNPSFNYPMELRLITFDESRIKQFIFQEDQKTKMSRLDSKSMNMNSPANLVTERLNRDIMFNLKGKIQRNEGNIDFGEFASIVEFIYFKLPNRDSGTPEVIKTEKELRDKLNYLTEHNNDWLTKKFNFKELMIILYLISKAENEYDSTADLYNKINNTLAKADELDKRVFTVKIPKKSMLNAIDKLGE